LFLPWNARPDRDPFWYERQKVDILQRTGSLDDLYEQYPASDLEALAPRTLDKRIAPEWLLQCFVEIPPLALIGIAEAPAIPGLVIYALPDPDHQYVIGVDPAEGNPTSDDSAMIVMDAFTGEEVASLAGKLQPAVLADHVNTVGKWYNHAKVMVERNNHGHAVLLALRNLGQLSLLSGHDNKEGWLSSQLGKVQLYDLCTDEFRIADVTLHSFVTFTQLASIDGSTLQARKGQQDDRADAFALACAGRPAARFVWKLREMDDRDKSLFHPSKVPPGVFLDDFPLQ
jgi:hypothetical protein